MSFFDFISRRGNPSNDWKRANDLELVVEFNPPSVNGVTLGLSFERLSFLGRSDTPEFGFLCYWDLGLGVGQNDKAFDQFEVVLVDEDDKYQPYQGRFTWQGREFDLREFDRETLPEIFGPWYWLDQDEYEYLAFFEYPGYEFQVEMTLEGKINRVIVTQPPSMADPQQRQDYHVDKPWPPVF